MLEGDFRIADDFPVGTSGRGLCFITQMPLRDVDVVGPGGSRDRRRERVVVTPRMIDPATIAPPPEPGQVAVSETAVREMGRLVGLVPVEELNQMRAERTRAIAALEQADAENEALRLQITALQAQIDARVRL